MRLSRENGLFFNIFLGHESGQLPGAPQLYSSVHETILNGLYMYMRLDYGTYNYNPYNCIYEKNGEKRRNNYIIYYIYK